jgi:hypothetical protein
VTARQLLANTIHGIRQGRRRSHCRLAIVDRMMLDGVFRHDAVVVESRAPEQNRHRVWQKTQKKSKNRSILQRPQESESGETKNKQSPKQKKKQQRIFQTPGNCMFPFSQKKVFSCTRVRKKNNRLVFEK